MHVVCLDLEGVLIPEIWISVAEQAGIEELKLTTRDIADYDELMTHRLRVCAEHGLGLPRIQEVISQLSPLPGAREFLDDLRARYQVVILSDTYYEFANPLMRQLQWPTLFCHHLEVDPDGRLVDYHLRQVDQKRRAVLALKDLNFSTIAAGDSYNDTSMLGAADAGILFRPPDNVVREFPQFPVVRTHADLHDALRNAAERLADA